ncbi:aldo/keto reductase [Bradyrhizobium frederickii]|uniref:Aldo/keto reductase n=1 Tax=Bradyrhizobium frederickii TaxID=2560054 RepID=A0A4Y9PPI7_9BRAD|nr:aldo/keto reductase [Bradyrhizobium frederickii]TFV80315.1 aldo/keto reductase [Bradyrhizobium frederickii]
MRYRPLGSTGIMVSAIGFGAWGIGGCTPGATSYGETDDQESLRALNAAFDHGITFYDTSNVYGDGHSEELIGACFAGRRSDVIIATKAGITASYRGYDFHPAALRTSLEDSLRRMRTDYVDVLQLHNGTPDTVMGSSELVELMQRFVAEGKVRCWGISTLSPDDALALIDVAGVGCFQVNCNILDWRAIDAGLPGAAASRGIGVIARTPLASGFLAGGIGKDTMFPANDHRSKWPRDRIVTWIDAAQAVVGSVNLADTPENRAALALRFCLSVDGVATVIPGMLTRREVLASVAACERGPLGRDVMLSIEGVYRRYEARLGA